MLVDCLLLKYQYHTDTALFG